MSASKVDELELVAGHVYEGKRPAAIGFPPLVNDRQIIWVGIAELQYDSPAVGFGRNYPRVTHEAFRRWASRDITDQMPAHSWRSPNAAKASEGES